MEYVPSFIAKLEWYRSIGHGVQLVCHVEGQLLLLPVHAMVEFVRSKYSVPLIFKLGAEWMGMANFKHLLSGLNI